MSGETTALSCLKCGARIVRKPGAGRPPSYCGAACKRLVEYEVRRLEKRVADYELEQRGLKYDGPAAHARDEHERQKRLRALRRWIREDEARLRDLVAGIRPGAAPDATNHEGDAP